jgi:hypothetical protein
MDGGAVAAVKTAVPLWVAGVSQNPTRALYRVVR